MKRNNKLVSPDKIRVIIASKHLFSYYSNYGIAQFLTGAMKNSNNQRILPWDNVNKVLLDTAMQWPLVHHNML